MIEKIILQSSTDNILKRYSIAINDYTLPLAPPYVAGNGSLSYVITSENPQELRSMTFGFTPHWAKEKMNLLMARAEGDKNAANDPFYNGPNSIFLKPAFKKAIQNYRCLVVADGFIEHLSGNQVIVSTNYQPSVFAGIYDYWKDPDTGIVVPGFALITVPAVGKLCDAGLSRMPVLLSYFNCTNWIRNGKHLNNYLPMLDRSGHEIANSLTVGYQTNQNTSGKNVEKTAPLPKRYFSKKHKHDFDGPTWGELRSRSSH